MVKFDKYMCNVIFKLIWAKNDFWLPWLHKKYNYNFGCIFLQLRGKAGNV